MMEKFLRWNNLPALILMGILFALSSRAGQPQSWLQPPLDKIVHIIAYGALGLSFCVWIRPQRWESRRGLHIALVLLAVGLFGITDEFHQSWVPGRVPSLGDWIADMIGGALAIALFLGTRSYRIYSRFSLKLFP